MKKYYTSLEKDRTDLGVTRKELAHSVNTTFETIRRIENGLVIPQLFLAIRISEYFGKDVTDMFWEE